MSDARLLAAGETIEAPVRRPRTGNLRPLLLGFLLPVGAAILWEIAVRTGLAQGRLAPPPSKIAATLSELAANGDLWLHARATLARVAAGFALGVLAGTLFGALAGASPQPRAGPSLNRTSTTAVRL